MKSKFRKMDKTLFFIMLAFTIFGLVMIFSASSITAVLARNAEAYYYFKKQFFIIIVSWMLGLVVLYYPIKNYKILGPLGIFVIIIALAGLFPYGSITNSVKRWYNLGFFSLQPSEFAKPIIIVYLAVALERISKNRNATLKQIITPFLFVGVITVLTAFQPDFGAAAIIGGIAFMIFLAIPLKVKNLNKLKIFGIIVVVIASSFLLFSGKFLNQEQSSRITFQAPCTRYTVKTGYQVCNGFLAISNGGLFGSGLGKSTQKYLYLPEAYTDFIFPIILEELGAIAGIGIIGLFMLMLYRILKIAISASDLKGSIIAYGAFSMILIHLLINFLGILALIPLTGIPLPFLSYGGSYYINLIFILFLTQRVKIETEQAKQNKALRA